MIRDNTRWEKSGAESAPGASAKVVVSFAVWGSRSYRSTFQGAGVTLVVSTFEMEDCICGVVGGIGIGRKMVLSRPLWGIFPSTVSRSPVLGFISPGSLFPSGSLDFIPSQENMT